MVMSELQGQGFQMGVGRGQQLGKGVANGHAVGGGLRSGNGTVGGCKGHRLQDGRQHLMGDTGNMELGQKRSRSWQKSWSW